MASTFTVQRVVAILRAAGVQLQDSRGPKRGQRAGLNVSRWQGFENRGATLVIVSLIKLDVSAARVWFDAAKVALIAVGAMIDEPHGAEALCLVITN